MLRVNLMSIVRKLSKRLGFQAQNKGLIGQSLWPVLQNQKLGPTGDP